MILTKILAVLLFAFALAGCGQSGQLYVPGDPSSVQEPENMGSEEETDENNEEDEG